MAQSIAVELATTVDWVAKMPANATARELCNLVVNAGKMTLHSDEHAVCMVWDEAEASIDWDLPVLSLDMPLRQAGCEFVAICACVGDEPDADLGLDAFALAIAQLLPARLAGNKPGLMVRCEINGARVTQPTSAARAVLGRLEHADESQHRCLDDSEQTISLADAAVDPGRPCGGATGSAAVQSSMTFVDEDEDPAPKLAVLADLAGIGVSNGVEIRGQENSFRAAARLAIGNRASWPASSTILGAHHSGILGSSIEAGEDWSSNSTDSSSNLDDWSPPGAGIDIPRTSCPSVAYMEARGVEYPWIRTGEPVQHPVSSVPAEGVKSGDVLFDVGVFPLQLRSGKRQTSTRGLIKSMILHNLSVGMAISKCRISLA